MMKNPGYFSAHIMVDGLRQKTEFMENGTGDRSAPAPY